MSAASLWQPAPLSGIKVVELAGLAPGPFCGLILADYGATVLRIDRAHPSAHLHHHSASPHDTASSSSTHATTPTPILPPPTNDHLTRNKASIALNLKSPRGLAVLRIILSTADVLIDPFRPGVLESLGLAPAALHKANPRLVVARLTGFRRDGPYAPMAGHDINYLAVSGVLSQLGRHGGGPGTTGEEQPGQPPDFPANLLGDFAGGGLMCATGILLALFARERRGGIVLGGGSGSPAGPSTGINTGGTGQVVEANMVDGAAYLGTFLRLTRKTPFQDGPRGTNLLDGGCPWYDVYETQDRGRYMAVGALEPQFFSLLAAGLGLDPSWNERRWDRDAWPELRGLIAARFRSKTRREWERVFAGKDACCTPVLEQAELERQGYEQRPAVGLSRTPGRRIVQDEAWTPKGLAPGEGGEKVLSEWLGWQRGEQYVVEKGGLVRVGGAGSKL